MSRAALDALQSILQSGALEAPRFPPNSRYAGATTLIHDRADGRRLMYIVRRFVPQPQDFETISEHVVVEGERLDHLAARYFGDPELFWRIADANGVLRPEQLTDEAGTRIRITAPRGMPGAGGSRG
ncbi:MAG TPA: hypothetical protein VKH19_03935 [Gemmatimonadaceae bacterium]|nr:hypothetical protein [Gemmatimonadaceae bacterium]